VSRGVVLAESIFPLSLFFLISSILLVFYYLVGNLFGNREVVLIKDKGGDEESKARPTLIINICLRVFYTTHLSVLLLVLSV